jgi:hypothetical protein
MKLKIIELNKSMTWHKTIIILLKTNWKKIDLKNKLKEKKKTIKKNTIAMNIFWYFYKRNAKIAFCLVFFFEHEKQIKKIKILLFFIFGYVYLGWSCSNVLWTHNP